MREITSRFAEVLPFHSGYEASVCRCGFCRHYLSCIACVRQQGGKAICRKWHVLVMLTLILQTSGQPTAQHVSDNVNELQELISQADRRRQDVVERAKRGADMLKQVCVLRCPGIGSHTLVSVQENVRERRRDLRFVCPHSRTCVRVRACVVDQPGGFKESR